MKRFSCLVLAFFLGCARKPSPAKAESKLLAFAELREFTEAQIDLLDSKVLYWKPGLSAVDARMVYQEARKIDESEADSYAIRASLKRAEAALQLAAPEVLDLDRQIDEKKAFRNDCESEAVKPSEEQSSSKMRTCARKLPAIKNDLEDLAAQKTAKLATLNAQQIELSAAYDRLCSEVLPRVERDNLAIMVSTARIQSALQGDIRKDKSLTLTLAVDGAGKPTGGLQRGTLMWESSNGESLLFTTEDPFRRLKRDSFTYASLGGELRFVAEFHADPLDPQFDPNSLLREARYEFRIARGYFELAAKLDCVIFAGEFLYQERFSDGSERHGRGIVKFLDHKID